MPSIIKNSMSRSSADNLLQNISTDRNNQYYFFIAKCTPWTNENSPDTYIDSDKSEKQIGRSIIGYKKLNPTDILYVVAKRDWTLNEIYDQYDDSIDLFNVDTPETFYVLNSQNNIYICISNADGAPSTVEPTSILSTVFKTADLYIWKYIGTVKEADLLGSTSLYIPINYITDSSVLETQNQYNTQLQAADGGISRVDVSVATGVTSGIYRHSVAITTTTSGLLVSRSVALSSTQTQLEITDISSLNQIINRENMPGGGSPGFNGYAVRVATNEGNISQINNYGVISAAGVTGSTSRYFIIENDTIGFTLSVIGNSNYPVIEILPFINIIGDGDGAYVSPIMADDLSIQGIDVINSGYNYSHAIMDIIPTPFQETTPPILTAVLAPKGGHGANILKELNADRIAMVARITPLDETKIKSGGSYRQVGIIKNPTLLSNPGELAGTSDIFYRDVLLLNTSTSTTSTLSASLFSATNITTNTTALLGLETFATAKVYAIKSTNDTSKKVLLKTASDSKSFIDYSDRPNDYIIGLDATATFTAGEKITQTIPVGVTFTVPGSGSVGISFGYSIEAEGIVLSISEITPGGYTLGVRSTKNSFAISTTAGVTGASSLASAKINSISPRYGEFVTTAQLSGGLTFTSDSKFKIIDVGDPYIDSLGLSSYTGLHALQVTGSGLSSSTFTTGDTVTQGQTGSIAIGYASAKVYTWELVNSSYGTLWVSEVTGQFKNIADGDSSTYSALGAYLVTGVSLPDINPNSGEILYIDSVVAIDRVVGQNEEFRLSVGF
jgi:hypothetical protein